MTRFLRAAVLCSSLFLAAAPSSANTGSAPAEEERPRAPEQLVEEATRGSDIAACWRDARLRGATPQPLPVGPATRASTRRLVLAIDASGSMASRIGGEAKMQAAKRAVTSFLATVPADVEVGLVLFGHRGSPRAADKSLSCQAGGETIFPLGGPRERVSEAVAAMRPAGWTPLAAALRHAGGLLSPSETVGEQAIWVVSDGVETCGGDPVAAARVLREGGLKAVVNIVGFDVAPRERAALEAVAAAGGGLFLAAANEGELEAALARSRSELQRLLNEAQANKTSFDNAISTYEANNGIWACFNALTSREWQRLGDLQQRGLDNGSLSFEEHGAATRLLNARHGELTAKITTLSDALYAKTEAKDAEIEAALRRVMDGSP